MNLRTSAFKIVMSQRPTRNPQEDVAERVRLLQLLFEDVSVQGVSLVNSSIAARTLIFGRGNSDPFDLNSTIPPLVASRGWTSGIDVHLGRDICWATVCYDGTPQLKGTIRESFGRDYFAPYLKSLLQSYPSLSFLSCLFLTHPFFSL